jgi:3-hydroxyisobutyrate dehydrogenase-like beta-hydroxyacid dehydrogenase
MARDWNLNLKAMQVAFEYFQKCSAQGYGQEDCNAVCKIVGE